MFVTMNTDIQKKPKKREDEAPLDAIRLMLGGHRIKLDTAIHQVNDLPIDDQLEYYFVPVEFMKHYAPYHRPGKPFKNIKLVNYNRPAIALSFTRRHKYVTQRDPHPADVQLHLRTHRDELLERSMAQALTSEQQNDLRLTDELLRQLREDSQAIECCFSNYHHYYYYHYCSYRHFEDVELTRTGSVSEHLLKHTERIEGRVHERLNIIFIDPVNISKQIAYDNKKIDRDLATYPIQIRQGITTLYIRKP